MNRQEHLLTILGEECSELHQAISKILRFGINSNYDNGVNNLDQMQKEFNDVLAMVEMVNDEFLRTKSPNIIYFNRALTEAKTEKVEKYLLYSKECGTLND